jgi:tetrathionate reductase subunit C
MVEVLYNVHHQETFGMWIAIYFYLQGISAGSFVLSTIAYVFGQTKYKPIGKIAIVLAIVILITAPLALLIHVGKPLRAWRLFYEINLISPISWGSFLLTLYPLNCFVYGYYMFKENHRMAKVFGMIGIPLAVAYYAYCGFILSFATARPLWNTALMPILFVVAAIVSGIALLICVIFIKERFFSRDQAVNEELIFDLGKLLGAFILLDIFLVLCHVVMLFTGQADAIKVGNLILTGKFGIFFLGVENGLGKILPFFLIFSGRFSTVNRVVLASLLVIIGIFFMRYVLVLAGEFYPLI